MKNDLRNYWKRIGAVNLVPDPDDPVVPDPPPDPPPGGGRV